MNRFFAKGFVILLIIFAFFTVASRASDSFLVAQVTVEQPSAKKIEHIVTTEGTVEKNLEIPITAEAGLLVGTVYVKEGEQVEEGSVLAQLDLEWLKEETSLLEDEIKTLRLQNEAIAHNEELAGEERQKQLARAKEDYEAAAAKSSEATERAASELSQAKEAIDRFEAGEEKNAMSASEQEEKRTQLWQDYFAKQQAYEDALSGGEESIREAQRALEDAGEEAQEDASREINELAIAQKEKQLLAYEELTQAGGMITAGQAGTVTGVFVETGQLTAETAAFTISSREGGVRLGAVIAETDAAYVERGDTVSVEKNGKTYENFSVTGISSREDGSLLLTVSAGEYTDALQIGDTVTLRVTKQSELYRTAIPLGAIHTEQNETYVYVAEERDTALGTQLFARKVKVNVLEKNDTWAALEEGALSEDDWVITDTDSYVQAGERVRLRES